jgi:hypothetical protein
MQTTAQPCNPEKRKNTKKKKTNPLLRDNLLHNLLHNPALQTETTPTHPCEEERHHNEPDDVVCECRESGRERQGLGGNGG